MRRRAPRYFTLSQSILDPSLAGHRGPPVAFTKYGAVSAAPTRPQRTFSSAGLSSVRKRTRPHQRRSLCVSPRRTKPSSGLVFDRRGWPGFRPALTPDPWNAPEIRHIRASGACTLAANGRADTEVSGQVCRAAGSNYEGVAQSDVVRECDNAGTGVNAPATGLGSSWLRIREVVSAGRRNTMGVFVDRSGGVW
jgi:hypothetical protein